ncbi:hypothetical protein ID866_5326 [Astraeus odoratus]|nr:hypothetical protein ID866_5326 [Astraeus odoratus]
MKVSLVSAGLAVASLVNIALAGGVYILSDNIVGNDFYNAFIFEAIADPAHGRVNYTDQVTAQQLGLVSATQNSFTLSADDTTVLSATGPGRNSFRIRSTGLYTTHVAIFDIVHMPEGCGTWPVGFSLTVVFSDFNFLTQAVWETLESDWPNSGEIDIVEGVNNVSPNQVHLHTGANNSNVGCGSAFDYAPASFGPQFNAIGGGWYAVERTNDYISIWFWGRSDQSVPVEVTMAASAINTSNWGTPAAYFSNIDCNLASLFGSNNIIINLSFCGDWAGEAYSSSGCPSTCVDYVNNNPQAFTGAYFQFASIRVYQ